MQETSLEVGAVRNAKARADGAVKAAFVPMLGFNEGDSAGCVDRWCCRKRRARNRRTGHESTTRWRSVRGRIYFPTHSIVQRQVWPDLPFFLEVEVVLVQVMLLSIERDLVSRFERQENVLRKVRNKDLRN